MYSVIFHSFSVFLFHLNISDEYSDCSFGVKQNCTPLDTIKLFMPKRTINCSTFQEQFIFLSSLKVILKKRVDFDNARRFLII